MAPIQFGVFALQDQVAISFQVRAINFGPSLESSGSLHWLIRLRSLISVLNGWIKYKIALVFRED